METEEYDSVRTKYVESQGFKVMRFWNSQVMGEMEAVKQLIFEALEGE